MLVGSRSRGDRFNTGMDMKKSRFLGKFCPFHSTFARGGQCGQVTAGLAARALQPARRLAEG